MAIGKNGIIQVGVVGTGRGKAFMTNIKGLMKEYGMELVAVCDTWEEKLKKVGQELNVATYIDYEKFLEHDMDAVILANYFHEHAPFAIKALEAGKHVLSETSCNFTVAEGVALCRAVEKFGLIYMLAENYPYTKFSQEMRRIYLSGEIGEVTYAEGEYNHPMQKDEALKISPGIYHWRNWLPNAYYNTHALAPLMYITDTIPVSVNALSIPRKKDLDSVQTLDLGYVLLCRMDNGSVFKLFGGDVAGHSIWYRVHGTRGAMETTRGPGYWGPQQVRVWHEEWDLKPGEVTEKVYVPEWPEYGELAEKAGHGGGDFWVLYYFGEAIRKGEQPYFDVYRGVTMSTVGILAWKSALEDGHPYNIPDFRNESKRVKYENDTWSPFPKDKDKRLDQPYPSILGKIQPTKEAVELARKIWTDIGREDVLKTL
jgi:predicted dehydrogenase